jgi:hypothetical protein
MSILAVRATAMKFSTHAQIEQQLARADGPVGQSEEMAEDADEFSDAPTVSSRHNPAVSPVSRDSESRAARTQTGAYRLIRPATSDHLDLADPLSAAKTVKKRTVIGVTRRR